MAQARKGRLIDNKKFWSEFSAKYWENKPAHFKNAQLPIHQIDADCVFNWLVAYSEYCRRKKTTEGLKFFINGESQYQAEVLQALPEKSDKSLVGYHQRMSQIFSDYCLVCDELIQVSGDKWDVLGDFVNGLYQRVGIPNRQTEIGLYLGNYKKTPFGVHVDGCGVFSIPVVGKKKFRIWKPEYVRKNPDLREAFDYEAHLKKSLLLTATVGDLTYWPSSAWHIAESDGAFSATWSIGVWVDQPYIDVLVQTLQPHLEKYLGQAAQKKLIAANAPKNGEVKKLPPLFKLSSDILKNMSGSELDDLFLKKWLQVRSRHGFKSVPFKHKKVPFGKSASLRGDEKNPVLWARLGDGSCCLASHGEILTLPKMKSLNSFIKALNSGKEFELQTFQTELNEKQKRQLLNVVQKLVQLGRVVSTY